jgi:hypothetical protein
MELYGEIREITSNPLNPVGAANYFLGGVRRAFIYTPTQELIEKGVSKDILKKSLQISGMATTTALNIIMAVSDTSELETIPLGVQVLAQTANGAVRIGKNIRKGFQRHLENERLEARVDQLSSGN